MLEQGVRVHTGCRALSIDPADKRVLVQMEDGSQSFAAYDRLVIATGARPSCRA
jgi:NADPH-dependent 2,4-dienoyl-CoA reductase/sulfur reductase-like enzyme